MAEEAKEVVEVESATPSSPTAPRYARPGRKAASKPTLHRPRVWYPALGIAAASACAVSALLASTCALGAPAAVASQPARRVNQSTLLCASATRVTRLVVRRTDAFPQNHFRFSFSSRVVVDESAAVRKVARALCALTVMPHQAINCPADFEITYHLQFSRARERFRVVTLDATGCETVRGLARPRWTARSPRFWRVLGTAMRLESPTLATLRGTRAKE